MRSSPTPTLGEGSDAESAIDTDVAVATVSRQGRIWTVIGSGFVDLDMRKYGMA